MLPILEFMFRDTTTMIGFIILIAVLLNGTAQIIRACRQPMVVQPQGEINNWNTGHELSEVLPEDLEEEEFEEDSTSDLED